jgi:HSP20 family protein
MSIVKWSPLREVEAMHNEMNRLFSRLGAFGGFNGGQADGGQWMLPVDVTETPGALKLKAALPGVEPRDVNIEVSDNVLTITAERRHEDRVEEGGYQWVEQQYGTFARSVTLPRSVDTEKIEARYNNGVLELTVPKKESAKPRRIELQPGSSQPQAIEAGMQQPEAPAQK